MRTRPFRCTAKKTAGFGLFLHTHAARHTGGYCRMQRFSTMFRGQGIIIRVGTRNRAANLSWESDLYLNFGIGSESAPGLETPSPVKYDQKHSYASTTRYSYAEPTLSGLSHHLAKRTTITFASNQSISAKSRKYRGRDEQEALSHRRRKESCEENETPLRLGAIAADKGERPKKKPR